jgi:hypothetical protein
MKAKLVVFLLALVLCFAANASAPASLTITPDTQGGVFNVLYKTAMSGKVKISILDNHNEVVFTEVLNNVASFKRPYNFNELTAGEYTIVVENKNGRYEEKVNHLQNPVKTFLKVGKISDTRYTVNVTSTGTEDVTLRIYDNVSGLVHEQSFIIDGGYGLIYNLSKVKSSPESIVIFEISTASGDFQTQMF